MALWFLPSTKQAGLASILTLDPNARSIAVKSVSDLMEGGEFQSDEARFLLEGLEATSSREVTLETVDPLKPAVLRGHDAPGFLYLLMPVRIA